MKRKKLLYNIRTICPLLAKFVRNCYNPPSQLFIIGGVEIRSTEGSTEGDPTSMVVHAIAIIQLILMIVDIRHQDNSSTKTAVYVDDFTAVGKITQLKKNGGMHYISSVPNLATILKVENPGLL